MNRTLGMKDQRSHLSTVLMHCFMCKPYISMFLCIKCVMWFWCVWTYSKADREESLSPLLSITPVLLTVNGYFSTNRWHMIIIHLSSFCTAYPPHTLAQSLELIPGGSGVQGTLDGMPIHQRAQSHTHIHTTGNLEMPTDPPCMRNTTDFTHPGKWQYLNPQP